MSSSRREFLRLTAAAATIPWPLSNLSRAAVLEPPRASGPEGLILLYSNENAYGPSQKVAQAIQAAAANVYRYPRLHYSTLTEQIASAHRTTPDRIVMGCGSTEVLRMAAMSFLGKGKRLIQAGPTFEALGNYATSVESEIVPVRLTSSYAHDLDGMLARVTSSTGLVYICNPNNPTASLTPRKDLESFIGKLPASVTVVIDEAYHHFAGSSDMYASFIDRPLEDNRVIVLRTFSKVYGLAGMRLGYAIASPKVVQRLRNFSSQDNINAIATFAAGAALQDRNGTDEAIQRNRNDRQEFFNQAMARAVKPIDSHTNFVMMNTMHPVDELIQHFRKNNIMIGRHFPPLDTYIRVSLGLPEEMQAFWHAWDLLPWAKNLMMH